jgi:hypothetical protein
MKFEVSRHIFEKSSNPNFIKIRAVTADLFQAYVRTDRQADTHNEADVRFSQFHKRAENFTFVILLNVDKQIYNMACSVNTVIDSRAVRLT